MGNQNSQRPYTQRQLRVGELVKQNLEKVKIQVWNILIGSCLFFYQQNQAHLISNLKKVQTWIIDMIKKK